MNQVNIHAGLLYAQLKIIFPYDFIQTNVKKEHKIKFPASDSYMEFDFYIEQYGLCFEFQDTYHYVNTWYNHDTQTHIKWKDSVKNSTVRQHGMTFVDVSCWWDGSVEQLVASIKFKRPDVLPTLPDYAPIPFNPPFGYFQANELPGVGELMLASFPPDSNFSASVSANTWWMGEKFDGIRCYWNPANKTGYTRYMNELSFLPTFTNCLPDFPIDSEIWFGRGQFGAIYGLVRDSVEVSWFSLRAIVFDLPLAGSLIYEDRFQFLLSHINDESPVSILAPRVLCAGSAHLSSSVQSIIDEGGEGVILQHIASPYQNGRSPYLYKVKAAPSDAEAIVISIEEDKSVKLQQPHGTTFTVPASDVHARVRVGDVVTYSFEGHARREVPVNPKIFRVRTDVLWDDIVHSVRSAQQYHDEIPQDAENYTTEAHGHWTASKGKNIRTFLENFAKKRNLDPLDPNTWYMLTRKDIEKAKGGATVVNYFKGGFVKNIMKLFPEIGLIENNFSDYTNISFHWVDVAKRREWLEEYAKKKGFEPLVPKNWYNITMETIDDPETRALLQHYSGNMVKALTHIFPEFELDPKLFVPIHRKYFSKYAIKLGLNPKLAKTWYNLNIPALFAWKRGRRILSLYNYDLYETLRHLFPEMRIDPAKCPPTKKYWQSEMNRIKKRKKLNGEEEKRGYGFLKSARRRFFLKFAEDHTFDPYILDNWYSTTKEALRNTSGSRNILYYYDSFTKALLDLFPNLPWDKSKLSHLSSDEIDGGERLQLVLQFAADNKIDINNPESMYSINKSDFLAFPGSRKMLSFYNNSLARALVSLFPALKLDPSKFKFLRNYWKDIGKRLYFFETFAKDNSFDPHVPENWYPIRPEQILAIPGGRNLLSMYGNSLYRTLQELFPDMNLQKSKFQYIRNYWEQASNRRKFFEGIANIRGFDPLIAKNWYSFPTSSFVAAKGAGNVLSKHKSYAQALVDLFPDVKFDLTQFHGRGSVEKSADLGKIDENKMERRKFFEEFAQERNFDPLVPANWYQISNEEIMRARGVHGVLAHYSGIVRALMDIFPEIGLDESKFPHVPNRHWLELGNRRKVFENFAKENRFDPLVPNNWYKVPKETLLAKKGVASILSYYNSSISQALLDLFPNIGLDEYKFATIPKHYWKDKENRKRYLEGFAKAQGFDPRVPENWYPLPKENLIYSMQNGKIVNIKGSKQILEHHGSMGKALADLFPEAGFDPSKFTYL
eukprot:Phypoly_transcript_00389.p1 GENE.Phypoly_transcript_00389~~Phypoly_transcript_00389.p1  ORF type:complete len:1231 (+),score=194.32 Phypoly_transcript_00389:52-3744(+)